MSDPKIEAMFKAKQARINRAISAKEKSIAYMNSVNSSIEMLKAMRMACPKGDYSPEAERNFILTWRNWFYEQWQEWYMKNMAIEEKWIPSEVLQAKADSIPPEEYDKSQHIAE